MSNEITEMQPLTFEVSVKTPIIADAYYSRKDLQVLGICGWLTALLHERKGKLKASRIGRLVRYRGADILQWLETCKTD